VRSQGSRRRSVALALLFAVIAGVAFADDLADCNQQQDLDVRIRGCTALMKLPQLAAGDRAIVLQLRGTAYREKKDWERALADFNEAMVLAVDEPVKVQTAAGIMLVFTSAPPELRKTAAGRKAIELMERNFQKAKAQKPAVK
jgi:hypothetical protein